MSQFPIITYEQNEHNETVRVETYENGTEIRSLDKPPATFAPSRVLSKLAFRRRFTRQEKAAIEMAAIIRADATPQEQQLAAALRADLKDQEAAQHIDLSDPDVIAGVTSLEAFGLLAAGRAQEILSAEVLDSEHP